MVIDATLPEFIVAVLPKPMFTCLKTIPVVGTPETVTLSVADPPAAIDVEVVFENVYNV
jgi:hypothetical protein